MCSIKIHIFWGCCLVKMRKNELFTICIICSVPKHTLKTCTRTLHTICLSTWISRWASDKIHPLFITMPSLSHTPDSLSISLALFIYVFVIVLSAASYFRYFVSSIELCMEFYSVVLFDGALQARSCTQVIVDIVEIERDRQIDQPVWPIPSGHFLVLLWSNYIHLSSWQNAKTQFESEKKNHVIHWYIIDINPLWQSTVLIYDHPDSMTKCANHKIFTRYRDRKREVAEAPIE